MAKKDMTSPPVAREIGLRERAEDELKAHGNVPARHVEVPTDDAERLVHEVHVHQVELEMQNEELQQSQVEMQTARDRFKDLFDFAPVGFFILDQKGIITEANLTGAALLGVARKPLIGHPLSRYVTPESATAFQLFRNESYSDQTQHSLVVGMVKTDGTLYVAKLDAATTRDEPGRIPALYVAVTDVTPLANAERALRESEEKYRRLIGNVPGVTWTRDGQGRVTFVSPNIEAVCGFTAAEIIGTDLRFWKKQLHPEDAPLVIHSLLQMLSHGEALDIEYRFRRKDGNWIWLLSRALRRTEDRNMVRVDGMIIDITERKRAHEMTRDLQRKQGSMEKQAALGQMAATVAHEINNPLAGIQNAFLMLRKAVPADHPNLVFADLIDKEMHRLTEIVRQMTLLYRPATANHFECDAVAAVIDTMQILASDAHSRSVNLAVTNDLPELTVHMHDGELRQVIYNIVINALRASLPGSEVHILVERDGEKALIHVSDHGPGITGNILPHIFEPFFTTKKRDESSGMGLGLSVSRGLVEAMGGCIEVITKPGEGSTFTVVLPCAQGGGNGAAA